jgi:shikimate dehydrogenase
MQWAEKNGAEIIENGLGMLVEQAAEAFFIWTNLMPETAPVFHQLKKISEFNV